MPWGFSPCTSRFISQTLAYDAAKDRVGALSIVHAKGYALIVAEVKFREVAVKVLFGAMLIGAAHAALENRKVAFDGVGVNAAANVFASRMLDGHVAEEILSDSRIETAFVGEQHAFGGDVSGNENHNVFFGGRCHMEGANRSVALNQAKHGALVRRAAAALFNEGFASGASGTLVGALSEIGFIDLNDFAVAAERAKIAVAHGFTNAVRDEPRSFQGNAKGAVKLVARNALFG